jgi:hypothetical protein
MAISKDTLLPSGLTFGEASLELDRLWSDEAHLAKPSPKSLTLKELEELGISTEPHMVISNRPEPNSKK